MRIKLILKVGLEIILFFVLMIGVVWALSVFLLPFNELILYMSSIISVSIALGVTVLIPHLRKLLAPQLDISIEYDADDKSFQYESPHPYHSGSPETYNETFHYIKIKNDGDRIALNCSVRIKIYDENKEEVEPFSPLSRRFEDYKHFSLAAHLDDVMDFCMERDDLLENLFFCSKAGMESWRRSKYDRFKFGSYIILVQVTADELKEPKLYWFSVTKEEAGYGKGSIIIKRRKGLDGEGRKLPPESRRKGPDHHT